MMLGGKGRYPAKGSRSKACSIRARTAAFAKNQRARPGPCVSLQSSAVASTPLPVTTAVTVVAVVKYIGRLVTCVPSG